MHTSDPLEPARAADPVRGRPPASTLLAVVLGGGLLGVTLAAVVAFALLPGGPPDRDRPSTDTPAASAPALDAVDHRAADAGYAVWDRDDDGAPVRWDPCTPIELVLSPTGAPAGVDVDTLQRDLEAAATIIAEASGLDLRVVDTTDERASSDRSTVSDDGRRWAPVLIGWRDPHATDLPLRDTDRAIAVPVAVDDGATTGFVTGQIVLNGQRDDLRTGSDDRADTWGAVLTHELGHLIGLDHVDDPAQLMYRYPGTGPVTLGAGDRAGLAALGGEGGCLDLAAPTDLDVVVPDR